MEIRIGELAQRTGCEVVTIRYYEKEGLLPEPARSSGNYRLYGEEQVKRMQFIRHCRSLDMSLGEIRTLLNLWDSPTQDCGKVNALLDDHIRQVEADFAEAIAEHLARRSGSDDRLRIAVTSRTIAAAVFGAMEVWMLGAERSLADLARMCHQALDQLAAGST